MRVNSEVNRVMSALAADRSHSGGDCGVRLISDEKTSLLTSDGVSSQPKQGFARTQCRLKDCLLIEVHGL